MLTYLYTGKGLSTGAIVGITIGSFAGVAAVIAAAILIIFKRRRRPAETERVTVPGVQHPPWVHEKPTDPVAVEADGSRLATRHELPNEAYH
jgi:hypothetical protein